jgi:PAS domain S-box-containing protein
MPSSETDPSSSPSLPGGEFHADENLYRTLTEVASVGLWHIDDQGITRYANPAMLRMLEVDSLEWIIGKHFSGFITPDGLAIVKVEHAKRAKGLSSVYETRLLGHKGRQTEVVVSWDAADERKSAEGHDRLVPRSHQSPRHGKGAPYQPGIAPVCGGESPVRLLGNWTGRPLLPAERGRQSELGRSIGKTSGGSRDLEGDARDLD